MHHRAITIEETVAEISRFFDFKMVAVNHLEFVTRVFGLLRKMSI